MSSKCYKYRINHGQRFESELSLVHDKTVLRKDFFSPAGMYRKNNYMAVLWVLSLVLWLL